jgi:hypothetical protein
MQKQACYAVVGATPDFVIIRDVGPWDEHATVTNDAEGVVAEIAAELRGRRLLCFDSLGRLDELLVKDGRFAGFRAFQRGD